MDGRSHELLDDVCRQVIRLTPLVERDARHADAPHQHVHDRRGTVPARRIAVQHQQHPVEMGAEEVRLLS
jgi:hypothetical protein